MNKFSTLKMKRLLPVIPLALGFVAVTAAAHESSSAPQAAQVDGASTATNTPEPSPSHAPDITVNGQKVDTSQNGETNVSSSDGSKTQVKTSGDSTSVSTSHSTSGSSDNANNGNVNVTVNSESSGGSGESETTFYNSSTNTTNGGSSHGFTSTQVFSTGPAHVEVNNP